LGEDSELKREIGTFGAFSMGYADVGADIYISLGLIALYALQAAPIALLIASITYITTGLSYAELASTYPVAGGAQYYAYKAFGKLNGFLAGWGLMLDYTVNIALFSLAAVGYLGFLVEAFWGSEIILMNPYYGACAIALILALIVLNIIGIKYSSRFNELFVMFDLFTVGVLLLSGIVTLLLSGRAVTWFNSLSNIGETPSWSGFAYAITLSMASYIGIESISQAAEETKNPKRIIPTATKAAIISVLIVALTASLLSVTLLDVSTIGSRAQDPMVALASSIPYIGGLLSLWIGFMGFMICYVSTNTGIIGVSRVTFSMGRLKLSPQIFRKVHSRFRTPYVTIIIFPFIAIAIIVSNIFLSSLDLLELVASLYNFGALISYMYVNLALVVLHKESKGAGWRTPYVIRVPYHGKKTELPLVPIIGFISCFIIWVMMVITHEQGRLLGFAWFSLGAILYLVMHLKKRRRKNE